MGSLPTTKTSCRAFLTVAFYDEAIALRDARRLAVNGDTDKPLTFKLWVDEPDWRPKDWQGQFIK
ncbi:hypothetical protein [Labrys neptuniae]